MSQPLRYNAGFNPRAAAFGAVAVQPKNKEQIQQMSQIAYKTKETLEKRFGSPTPVIMKAGITQDTVTFSSTGVSAAKQTLIDAVMQFYLRKTNIPFKQI